MQSLMQARIGTVIFINLWKDGERYMVEHVNIMQDGYKARAVIGARRKVKHFERQYVAAHYYTSTVSDIIEVID